MFLSAGQVAASSSSLDFFRERLSAHASGRDPAQLAPQAWLDFAADPENTFKLDTLLQVLTESSNISYTSAAALRGLWVRESKNLAVNYATKILHDEQGPSLLEEAAMLPGLGGLGGRVPMPPPAFSDVAYNASRAAFSGAVEVFPITTLAEESALALLPEAGAGSAVASAEIIAPILVMLGMSYFLFADFGGGAREEYGQGDSATVRDPGGLRDAPVDAGVSPLATGVAAGALLKLAEGSGAPLPPPSPERLPPEEKAKRKQLELPPFQLTDMREQAGTLKLELPEAEKNKELKDPEEKRVTIGDAAEERATIGDQEVDGPKKDPDREAEAKKIAAGIIDPQDALRQIVEEEEDDDDVKGLGTQRKKALAAATLPKALEILQRDVFKPENVKPGNLPTQAQTNRALTRAIEIFYTRNARGDYVIEPPTTWLQINFFAYVQQNAAELGLVGRKGVEDGVVVEPTPQENPAVTAWLARRAERGVRLLPQIDLEAAKRNRAAPIQTLIGRAAGPASAVRLLTMEDFRAALGDNIFAEFQNYFADQSNNTLFDFTLHYFRLFFHRNPEMFGHPELLATAEIDQAIIADIFTHVEHASDRFDENMVREFSELFQLTVNEAAATAQHAEILAGTTTPRASATVATRNYLSYPQDAAGQALGLGGFLSQLPGFTEREVRELFQAEVGRLQSTVFEWGSVRSLKADGLSDQDFEAILAMRAARGETVPTEKAQVDALIWTEYTDYLREQGHLEYVTVHPRNDSLAAVFNVYTFAREYAQAQGMDIDFFDFLCALSPPFRRLRERSRSEDGRQTVYIAVPSFMRELPFANWGYSTWAQLFKQRSIASHVLPATMHQHATGDTEFPEYQMLMYYTARINDEHESAYNFAASLMRWAFLLDNGLEVHDVSGTAVTQTNIAETPSRFRIQLVDDPSEIPEGGEAIVSGSRLAIRHDAQRGVYANQLDFVGNYLEAIALLPEHVTLRDHNSQVVELQTIRDQLELLREQERVYATVLSDKNPELAATRSHQNLENIFQFYRELHHFIDQTLFFTAVRGEVTTAHGPTPFRTAADVSNIQRDAFTWTGDTVVVVDDIPAAATSGRWSAQDISDLLQCRTLVAFLRGISEFPQANGIPSEAEVVNALQAHWHGTPAALTSAAHRYVQLEQARLERTRTFDESSTAPKPTGGRRTQQIFGPVLPARRFAGTWQDQFFEFAVARDISPELATTGQAVLQEYFRTVPASVTHFWPVALERIIAAHVPVIAEREPLSRTIVEFLPSVGVANEVVSRQLDPSRKLEDQIGEWTKTDYIALFPIREGLEGSKVPVENALIDELIDHTMEQHAAGRALRRRDIRAYVVRELGLYNQGRPEPSRELGAADLLLADHGRATERLNNFCAHWETQHTGAPLDRSIMRRGYQSLMERVLLGESISAAQISQALGAASSSQNIEVLQGFIAQQAHDLRTLQTYIGTQGAGIDAYVRQQFRNTDYVNADGLIALATHHARRVLATDGDIDIVAIALDAVDPSFEPYRSIAERMAVSYQALYRHFAHNLARHFSSQVELVQAAILTVSDDIQNRHLEIPATREAFATLIFEHASISGQQELTELNQHANLMQSIVGGAATTDLQQEINLAYDEITNFNERNQARIAEIQAEVTPLFASMSDFAERVATATDGYLALTAVRDDADEASARAAIAEANTGLSEIKKLQTELTTQRKSAEEIAVLLLEMNELGSTALDAENATAETQLRTAEAQLTSASTYLTTLREAAEFRLVVLEDDASNAEKIAKAREAAAQVQQEFSAITAEVEDRLGGADDYLRLMPQNHRKIMAALQQQELQPNLPLEEFDRLFDLVSQFQHDAETFINGALTHFDNVRGQFQDLNARAEQVLQSLPEEDRVAFNETYFAIHALFIRLTELTSQDLPVDDMFRAQETVLVQLEQRIAVAPAIGVLDGTHLPALVESDMRSEVVSGKTMTNRFRKSEATENYQNARRSLEDFLSARVSSDGVSSVLLARATAEQVLEWLEKGRSDALTVQDIFGLKTVLPEHAMPLAIFTHDQLPEDHPYARLLTAMSYLLSRSSNELRLVSELRKYPKFFYNILRVLAFSNPPITSNEQARYAVRRYAVSYISDILDILSEGNEAKRKKLSDRYFVIEEKRPLPSATPAPASTAAVATPAVRTAEQIRATLPTDLADLLPASAKTDAEIEAAIDALGVYPEPAEFQRLIEGWKQLTLEGVAEDAKKQEGPQRVMAIEMLGRTTIAVENSSGALKKSIVAISCLGLSDAVNESGLSTFHIRQNYSFLLQHRDQVLTTVAAHRAANPDPNASHPEMLPYHNYGRANISLTEIRADLESLGIAQSDIPRKDDSVVETGTWIIRTAATITDQLHLERVPAEMQHIDSLNKSQSLADNVTGVRAAYDFLIRNRSRIIAEVVKREEQAKAEAAAKLATPQPAPTPNLPADLADLLPATAKTDAEIEAAIDALGILPTGAEYETSAREWKQQTIIGIGESAKEIDERLNLQTVLIAVDQHIKTVEQLSNPQLKLYLLITQEGLSDKLTSHVNYNLSWPAQRLYQFLLKHRDQVLAAVAARRAANPDPNDPHPEMLPWSDYQRTNISLAEIRNGVAALGILSELAPVDTGTFKECMILIIHTAKILKEVGLEELSKQTGDLIPQNAGSSVVGDVAAVRKAYDRLIENRSRVIAEVVRRERAGEAMSQQPIAVVAPASSATDNTQAKMAAALALISRVDNFSTMDHAAFRQAIVDIGVQLGAKEPDIRGAERELADNMRKADRAGQGNVYYTRTGRATLLKWSNVNVSLSMLQELLAFARADATWLKNSVRPKENASAQYLAARAISDKHPLKDAEAEKLARAYYDELMTKISLVAAAVDVEAPTNVAPVISPAQAAPEPHAFSDSAKLLPRRGVQDPTLRNDIRKLFAAFQEVTPDLKHTAEMQARLAQAQEIGQRLKQRVDQRIQVTKAIYNSERELLANIYELQAFEEIRSLLNIFDPDEHLGDITVDRESAHWKRERFPSRAATDRGEIQSQALGRAYLVLLEHRDELIQLLEEKRAAFLAPRATPLGDQSLNSGLTFVGANPETTVPAVSAPSSRNPE